MSVPIRKHITVEIEFSDYKAIKEVFKQITEEIRVGKRHERKFTNGTIYQYQVDLMTYLEYEEKEINGKWCQVFQSKMNKPEPIKAYKNK